MNSKREKAMQLFKDGYNCSQAVFGAFCDELGMDFETAIKIRDKIIDLKTSKKH